MIDAWMKWGRTLARRTTHYLSNDTNFILSIDSSKFILFKFVHLRIESAGHHLLTFLLLFSLSLVFSFPSRMAELPEDTLSTIFSLVNTFDFGTIPLVSRGWNSVLTTRSSLWRHIALTDDLLSSPEGRCQLLELSTNRSKGTLISIDFRDGLHDPLQCSRIQSSLEISKATMKSIDVSMHFQQLDLGFWSSFPNLERLNLSPCHLPEVGSSGQSSRLSFLAISFEELLPPSQKELEWLSHLKALHLFYSYATDEMLPKQVEDLISNCSSSLVHLTLDWSEGGEPPDCVNWETDSEINAKLIELPSLERLHLPGEESDSYCLNFFRAPNLKELGAREIMLDHLDLPNAGVKSLRIYTNASSIFDLKFTYDSSDSYETMMMMASYDPNERVLETLSSIFTTTSMFREVERIQFVKSRADAYSIDGFLEQLIGMWIYETKPNSHQITQVYLDKEQKFDRKRLAQTFLNRELNGHSQQILHPRIKLYLDRDDVQEFKEEENRIFGCLLPEVAKVVRRTEVKELGEWED